MTEREALLQAVLANPDDDATRLVFADWLEEHGEAERAEFIRVQVELPKRRPGDIRRLALEKTQDHLLYQHADAWRSELPRLDGITWGEFRRGFVAEVEVAGLDACRKPLAAARARAPVECLNARRLRPQDVVELVSSPCLVGLHELDLDWTLAGDAAARALAASPHAADLTSLNLRACGLTAAGVAALAASPHVAALSALRLGDNPGVGPRGAEAVASAPAFAGLSELYLEGNGIGDEGAAALFRSPHLTRLTFLEIRGDRLSAAAARALAGGPDRLRLLYLSLWGNSLGDAGAKVLADWRGLVHFDYLDLAQNRIGLAGLRDLIDSPALAEVAQVYMGYGPGHDETQWRPRFLSLHGNGIGDTGARALARSRRLGTLTIVALWSNAFGAEGVELLRARFGPAVVT